MAALFALGLFFAPLAAQEVPNALYATNYGTPDPVAAGATVTWTLQGLNDGTSTLVDIGWSSEQCGDASYPGPFAPGESTPLVTCDSTAPAEGAASNVTEFTATVQGTNEVLTQEVTAQVTVATPPPTTTTAPTPPTTAGNGVNIGDAVQQSLGAESSRRGELPETGTDPTVLLAGLAAAGAGATLLVTGRTRRR